MRQGSFVIPKYHDAFCAQVVSYILKVFDGFVVQARVQAVFPVRVMDWSRSFDLSHVLKPLPEGPSPSGILKVIKGEITTLEADEFFLGM
ncbi:MAG: hypothetical protein R2769_06175 [Saprospiraceae bacterium]